MLTKHTPFTTDDPKALKNELEREHQDIFEEFRALGTPTKKWRPVLATETVMSAAPYDLIICQGFDVTVRPPINANEGDSFRVARAGFGNVTTAPADGVLIQGGASDVLSSAGVREYQLADGNWFQVK